VKLLLDNGVPRSSGQLLLQQGINAIHVGEIGLARAGDRQILDHARLNKLIIVTLDADFHTLLALGGESSPSVIRIRIEGVKSPQLVRIISQVVQRFTKELLGGAALSVGRRAVRCHMLPLR
jgi:predicted nuclease of predicted toxin-antitoxin system